MSLPPEFEFEDPTKEAAEIGTTIPPADPLIYNSFPTYRRLSHDPEIQSLGQVKPFTGQSPVRGLASGQPLAVESYVTPFMGQAVLRKDWAAIRYWLMAFGLFKMSLLEGAAYITQAYREGAVYPQKILDLIDQLILTTHLKEQDIFGRPSKEYLRIYGKKPIGNVQKLTESIKMWIPRTAIPVDYALDAIYWYRTENPEAINLRLISELTLVDLYLFAGNPFERIPMQTLLSYIPDSVIFKRLSQVGSALLPKDPDSPRRVFQLRTIVGMSLFRFGYLSPLGFSYPVMVRFVSPNGNSENFPLIRLQISVSGGRTPQGQIVSPMCLLRLYLQIEGCRGFLDLTEWETLLREVEIYLPGYLQVYSLLKQVPVGSDEGEPRPIKQIPEDLERLPFPCLVCSSSDSDFPWCGHGICQNCQKQTGSVKCAFCREHFVSDNLTHFDLLEPNQQILNRISEVRSLSEKRKVSFDFINLKVKYPW